jgi:hypothetical protein
MDLKEKIPEPKAGDMAMKFRARPSRGSTATSKDILGIERCNCSAYPLRSAVNWL